MNQEEQNQNESETGRERQSDAKARTSDLSVIDIQAAEKFGVALDSTAEKFQALFGARDYIETYYPAIEDIDKVLAAYKKVDSAFRARKTVDVNHLMEEGGIDWEEAENLSIFSFQAEVLERLLLAFPRDQMKVLDVGGGPTVYQHIAMSLNAGEITHSEFLEQNRREALKWLRHGDDAYDWSSYFRLVKEIMKERSSLNDILGSLEQSQDRFAAENAKKIASLVFSGQTEGLEAQVRQALGERVVFCDVFQSGLGLAENTGFDMVGCGREGMVELLTSNFTVESATPERNQWEQGVKNIMEAVKPGGFIAMTAIRNSRFYKVGGEDLPATEVNEDDLKGIFSQNGFIVEELRVLTGSNKDEVGYDGMVFVFARKKDASN